MRFVGSTRGSPCCFLPRKIFHGCKITACFWDFIRTREVEMDWGEASEFFDKILGEVNTDDILSASEAQTRYHVIDRIVREVLHWNALANVSVEDRVGSQYIDYFLSCGDSKIVIEAKKAGAAFPSPTRREKLKISGSV